jgi:hypothetical protein
MLKPVERIARQGKVIVVVFVLVLGVLVSGAGTVAAQIVHSEAWSTSLPATFSYNLPAITLPAEAFPVPGMVLEGGGEMRTPLKEATAFAKALGVDQAALLDGMQAAGWEARYVSNVVLPTAGDPSDFLIGGWSSVTEHESPAGAQAAFALLDDSAVAGAVVLDAPQVGDASRLTQVSGVDNIGRNYVRMRYTFVHGDLVGSVALFWYDGAPSGPVDAATMATTAQALLDRMDAAAG